MRLILASASPAPARSARADRRGARRASSPPRSTRRRARASCRVPYARRMAADEGGGGRPSRARWSSPPTPSSPSAAASCPRPRARTRRAPPWRCSPAGATACISAVTLIDADGKARHRLSTSIVAFKRLSEAELAAYLASGEWRGKAGGYAIQGRAEALVRMRLGLLFGRGRPAALRDPRAAPRRRLPAWLSGSTRRGSARIARSWSRTARSSRPRSSCRGLRAGAVVAGAADQIDRRQPRIARATAARRWSRPLPPGLTEGAAFRAEIVREAIPEPGRPKLAQGARRPSCRSRAGPDASPSGSATRAARPPSAPTGSRRPAGPNCSRRRRAARSPSPAARCG